MILVTNLNGDQFYLNPGLIETIEAVPDTLITMANGRKYCVLESVQGVAEGIAAYRAQILRRSSDPLYLCADPVSYPGGPDALEE